MSITGYGGATECPESGLLSGHFNDGHFTD